MRFLVVFTINHGTWIRDTGNAMSLPVFLTNPLFCLLIPSFPCFVFLFNDTVTSLLQTSVKCWVSLVFCLKLNMAWKLNFWLFFGDLWAQSAVFLIEKTQAICQGVNIVAVLTGFVSWSFSVRSAEKWESHCHLLLGSGACVCTCAWGPGAVPSPAPAKLGAWDAVQALSLEDLWQAGRS